MKLLVINVIIWLVLNVSETIAFLVGGEALQLQYLQLERWLYFSPTTEFFYKPWSILTYAFCHKSLFHILFNMLGLYWFGKIVEELLGGKRVISLYVLGAISGALFLSLINPFMPRISYTHHVLGASASVFALLVGAATLRPTYSMFLLFIGAVQIKWLALIYVILSFIALRGGNAGGELAHLGGALMGYLFISQLKKGNDWGRWIESIRKWFGNIGKKQNQYPKAKYTNMKSNQYAKQTKSTTQNSNYSTYSNTSSHSFINQEEIDRILDKITESGYNSLTKDELDKLAKASKNNG
jgi:membrane associated rhomboid family serine protease